MNKPRLTIGAYYLAPYASTPEHVADLAACGIDVVMNMRNDRAALDLLAQHGVGAVVSGIVPGWFGGDGSNAGTMREKNPLDKYVLAAERFADHPAIVGIDAALKASDVELTEFFAPPSETNFGGALLTGTQSACHAACEAFASAVSAVAKEPKGGNYGI